MQLGSDDIIVPGFEKVIADKLKLGCAFFGFKEIYIYQSGKIKQVKTTRVFGAGRCIRKDIVKKCVPLWKPAQPFGLDNDSSRKIFNTTHIMPEILPGFGIIDIKTDQNINKYTVFPEPEQDAPDWIESLVNKSYI